MRKFTLFVALFTIGILISCSEAYIYQNEEIETIDRIVGYEEEIMQIMDEFCTGCHSGTSPSGELLLDTYIDVRRSTEFGNTLERINDLIRPMPQTGLMSLQTREIIKKWKEDGFPDHL